MLFVLRTIQQPTSMLPFYLQTYDWKRIRYNFCNIIQCFISYIWILSLYGEIGRNCRYIIQLIAQMFFFKCYLLEIGGCVDGRFNVCRENLFVTMLIVMMVVLSSSLLCLVEWLEDENYYAKLFSLLSLFKENFECLYSPNLFLWQFLFAEKGIRTKFKFPIFVQYVPFYSYVTKFP